MVGSPLTRVQRQGAEKPPTAKTALPPWNYKIERGKYYD